MAELKGQPAAGREPLPLEPLHRYLAGERLVAEGPLEASKIGHGQSNLTYLVQGGDTELVVRRPPPPPLPQSAHDVLREARILSALEGLLPVPRVLAACGDESVIGAPFYVMEKVEGWVITDDVPEPLASSADRRRIAEQLVDALVDLHAIDWRACGLFDLGRPSGYLGRQLRRFGQIWVGNRTRELPEIERVGSWLEAHIPREGAATIVHGDYRLGNAMFAPESPARLLALFDWEMATLGDPLADLGYLSAFWVQPDDPPLRIFELSRATRSGGFPTRAEIVARYEERSGRAVSALRWYEVLGMWKLAVIMEVNHRRARDGVVDNPYLAGFEDGVVEMARRAAEIAVAGRDGGG